MDTTTYEQLEVDVTSDGVATVWLNNPPRNEYTRALGADLTRAFANLEADDDVRAIVVTGKGDFFCAGAALGGRGAGNRQQGQQGRQQGQQENGEQAQQREQQAQARPRQQDGQQSDAARRRPWEMSTPIIAAINGHAVGVGMTWPTQWDIRIAAEDAKMGYVFIRRGWVPELGAHWILPRLVGVSTAMELLLTGKIITGVEAERIGLVSKALPRDQVLPYAQEMAREIAINCAPVSVAISKKLIWRMLAEPSIDTAQATDGRLYGWTTRQPDGREGVQAFLQKRQPNWTMSKTKDLPEEMR